jgi:hypothetical protein
VMIVGPGARLIFDAQALASGEAIRGSATLATKVKAHRAPAAHRQPLSRCPRYDKSYCSLCAPSPANLVPFSTERFLGP